MLCVTDVHSFLMLSTVTLMVGGCECDDLVVPQQQPPAVAPQPRPVDVTAQYRVIFETLARAARSHHLADLVPFISRRLRADLVQTLRQHRRRFWTHIDRLIRGIQSGLTVEPPQKRPDGRLDLKLRFGNGESMVPILVIEDGKPRIDRF